MPGWVEIVIWTFISIFSLFFVTKMIGKRQMNQMTFFEYIVGIAIGEIGAHMAMHLENKVINSVIALSIYAVFPVVIGWVSLKSKWVREFVNGKARPLVKKGHILTDNLGKERMTKEELLARLRLKDAFSLADVELALMENDGNISVHLQPEHSPITPEKMKSTFMNGQGTNRKEESAYPQGQSVEQNPILSTIDRGHKNDPLWEITKQSMQHIEQTVRKNCHEFQAFQTFTNDETLKNYLTSNVTQLETILSQLQTMELTTQSYQNHNQ